MTPRPASPLHCSPPVGPLPLEVHLGRLDGLLERERRERDAAFERWMTAFSPRPRPFAWSGLLPRLG